MDEVKDMDIVDAQHADIKQVDEAKEDEIVEDELKLAFDDVEELVNEDEKIPEYEKILTSSRADDNASKIKEQCIYRLAKLYTEKKEFTNIMNILKNNNSFFAQIPKARTAKIVRNVLDIVASVPDSLNIQVSLCRDVIEWCVVEKRTFLRQRIESKLAALLLQLKCGQEAVGIVNNLLRELKKLDDKQMLVEVHLVESRIHHSLLNIPKAKASLTAARAAANAIYVSPLLQAELDEMSGVLHCEEGDNITAYSYFLEAFEAYDGGGDARARKCLKYMCLAKTLGGHAGDIPGVLSGKKGMKYNTGKEIQAIASVGRAAKKRSLEDFQASVDENRDVLMSDDLTSHHLEALYEKMLESNLLKIIHPYSCVEIEHVARLINLPLALVEKKLSHMILDGKFSGILEQGKGHLVVYDAAGEDVSFTKGIEIIANMTLVVDALQSRADGLSRKAIAPPAAATTATTTPAVKSSA